MAVYVDEPAWQFGRMKMCHMIADTEQELHKMADTIGVRRQWAHYSNSGVLHYNVCRSKRSAAIAAGAVVVSVRQLVAIIRNQKQERANVIHNSSKKRQRRTGRRSKPAEESSGNSAKS